MHLSQSILQVLSVMIKQLIEVSTKRSHKNNTKRIPLQLALFDQKKKCILRWQNHTPSGTPLLQHSAYKTRKNIKFPHDKKVEGNKTIEDSTLMFLRNSVAWFIVFTCQDEEIVGTAPLLMASRNDCVRPASIGPVMTVAPTCLGLVRSNTNFVSASRLALNSGRNLSVCNTYITIRFFE
jgi:hypothetical protein